MFLNIDAALLRKKTQSDKETKWSFIYLIWRLWLPAVSAAIHIQRATVISAALLTSLFLSYSRDAQQRHETADDKELYLLLCVFR